MASQDELRSLLVDLIAERKRRKPKEDLNDFGAALARLISPDHKPYSKQHLKAREAGRARITPEAERALVAMAGIVFDGVSETQATARPVTITAYTDIPEGAQYGGTVRYCATVGCGLPFLPTNYFQRYCPRCQRERKQPRKKA